MGPGAAVPWGATPFLTPTLRAPPPKGTVTRPGSHQAQDGPAEKGGNSSVTCSVPPSQNHKTQWRIPKSPIWVFCPTSATVWGLRMAVLGPRNHHVLLFGFLVLFFLFEEMTDTFP